MTKTKEETQKDIESAITRVEIALGKYRNMTKLPQGQPLKLAKVVRLENTFYLLTTRGLWSASRASYDGIDAYTTEPGHQERAGRRTVRSCDGLYALEPMVALGVVTQKDALVFRERWFQLSAKLQVERDGRYKINQAVKRLRAAGYTVQPPPRKR